MGFDSRRAVRSVISFNLDTGFTLISQNMLSVLNLIVILFLLTFGSSLKFAKLQGFLLFLNGIQHGHQRPLLTLLEGRMASSKILVISRLVLILQV